MAGIALLQRCEQLRSAFVAKEPCNYSGGLLLYSSTAALVPQLVLVASNPSSALRNGVGPFRG